jgi:outer membrane protein assembly factor BamB
MNRPLFFCLLVVVALFAARVPVSAEEWSRFRGPNGTGESEVTTIPDNWTDHELNWNVKLPGLGISSPIIWGTRLFILSAEADGKTRYVLCYDAITGKQLWERRFESTPYHLHKQSSYASSTPAADAEYVFTAWATPDHTTVMALTHEGDAVWKKDLGTWRSQHGFGTSPIVVDDLVILSCSQEPFNGPDTVPEPESFMIALDRKTGKERWRTPRKTAVTSYSVPAIFQPKNRPEQLVSTSTGNGLFALDIQTGKELWSKIIFDKRTVSSPLVKQDLIFGSTGSGGGGNYLIAAHSEGEEPEMVYKMDSQAPYVPAVVARGDLLFLVGDAGIATCLDLRSGKVHWRNRIGGNFASSPVRAHDKLICVSSDGEVVILRADKEFQELGRVTLGEGTRATPAIANGRLYLRTYSQLMSVGGPEKSAEKP